jgi:hypothetical protein
MAGVYSTLFIAASGIGISAGYAVPSGHLAVVRDVMLVFAGAPDDTAAQCFDVTTATLIAYHLQVDPFEAYHWTGRQVVPAGATFELVSSGPGLVYGRCSGYLLTTP